MYCLVLPNVFPHTKNHPPERQAQCQALLSDTGSVPQVDFHLYFRSLATLCDARHRRPCVFPLPQHYPMYLPRTNRATAPQIPQGPPHSTATRGHVRPFPLPAFQVPHSSSARVLHRRWVGGFGDIVNQLTGPPCSPPHKKTTATTTTHTVIYLCPLLASNIPKFHPGHIVLFLETPFISVF